MFFLDLSYAFLYLNVVYVDAGTSRSSSGWLGHWGHSLQLVEAKLWNRTGWKLYCTESFSVVELCVVTWPQRKRTTKEVWERDLEKKEMWTAGHKYSWRKMEAAAQNRAEDGEVWSALCWQQQGSSRVKKAFMSWPNWHYENRLFNRSLSKFLRSDFLILGTIIDRFTYFLFTYLLTIKRRTDQPYWISPLLLICWLSEKTDQMLEN